ncbi:MAG TPA: hypothetical protein PKC84_07775, partial [Paracoccaceae bacterium]|nr:hypothetical protein [Paracoccaceae bacterium]
MNVTLPDPRSPRPSIPVPTADLRDAVLRHLTFSLGKDADHASRYDWRVALSLALRDRIVEPWF